MMKLIRALNDNANKIDPEKSKFKYLDVDDIRGVNDIVEGVEDNFNDQQKSDVAKLIKQYKSRSRGAGKPYRHEVGDDLEMLEYNPEEVDAMIKYIARELNL